MNFHPLVQWAAVNICLSVISAPPQNCCSNPCAISWGLYKAAIQGHSWILAFFVAVMELCPSDVIPHP